MFDASSQCGFHACRGAVGFRACGIELGTTVWGVVFIAWAPPCVDRLPTARRAEAAGVPDHSRGTASRSGAPQGLTLHPEPKTSHTSYPKPYAPDLQP